MQDAQPVLRRHGKGRPGGHRLLAEAVIERARDLALAVQAHRALLDAAHQQHRAQQPDPVLELEVPGARLGGGGLAVSVTISSSLSLLSRPGSPSGPVFKRPPRDRRGRPRRQGRPRLPHAAARVGPSPDGRSLQRMCWWIAHALAPTWRLAAAHVRRPDGRRGLIAVLLPPPADRSGVRGCGPGRGPQRGRGDGPLAPARALVRRRRPDLPVGVSRDCAGPWRCADRSDAGLGLAHRHALQRQQSPS